MTRDYDYIIVGGGAAGCVLAARLASESDGSVLLVERGQSDENQWIHVPAAFFKVLMSQDAETIESEPDSTLNGGTFAVPQGRVLGGGSSVNGMIYMRGQARDYDDWAQVYGCSGWSWQDVLPVFRRQECNTRLNNDHHGVDGRLVVSDPKPPHPVSGAIIEAALEAGIPATEDFNGASQQGAGWYQVMAHQGQRQSAAHCFLKPELERENLTLMTSTEVEQIGFEGRKAVSVEARSADGEPVVLRANREIILTAGSFQSPKLLMLSGIGPMEHLLKHGIDLIHESAEVGDNYQDHVGAPVTRKLRRPRGLYGSDLGARSLKHAFDYFVLKRGLLCSNLLDAGACVDSAGSGRPDIQFNFAPFAPGAPGQPPLGFHGLQVHPMTMRPRSRGRVELASSNPGDSIKFLANVLDHKDDVDTLRRGVAVAREICAQPALRKLVGEEIWPGPGVGADIHSDETEQAIRGQARTIFHPAGTCRMGSDINAVVDCELRVNGVENLRVADCSIMPALISGNTCAPTMMIADRCADFILG